ncbi:MAG: hypothetical protein U5M53_11135 [Rhodoferax sp.]|nr:hypothetical protein [Rhodoferax sp.]
MRMNLPVSQRWKCAARGGVRTVDLFVSGQRCSWRFRGDQTTPFFRHQPAKSCVGVRFKLAFVRVLCALYATENERCINTQFMR